MPDIKLYNPDASPALQTVFEASISTAFGFHQAKARDAFVRYGNRLLAWLGDGYIWEMFPVNASGTGRAGRNRLFSLANVTSMVAGLGKVWFVDTSEIIYNWDGTTLTTTTDPSVTATQPLLAFFNEDIFLIIDQATAGQPFLYKYGTGNWSTSYNTPAGLTVWKPACWQAYKNNLYIGGVGTTSGASKGIILKFDGSSVTTVNELDATDAPSSTAYAVGCTSMAVHAGTLYYVNQGVTGGTYFSYLGTFDNSTWTDQAKDFKAEVSATATDKVLVGKLSTYKNKLLVGVCEATPGVAYVLYGSATGTPTGSYVALSTDVISTGGIFDVIAA